MYSLKEGSRFEDFALMEALSEIIQTMNKSTGMRLVQLNFLVVLYMLPLRSPKLAARFKK